METFIQNKLARYDKEPLNPVLDVQSNLSPYLHFGQISPLAAADAEHSRQRQTRVSVHAGTTGDRPDTRCGLERGPTGNDTDRQDAQLYADVLGQENLEWTKTPQKVLNGAKVFEQ